MLCHVDELLWTCAEESARMYRQGYAPPAPQNTDPLPLKKIKWCEDDFSPQAYWAAKVTFAALMEDVVTP